MSFGTALKHGDLGAESERADRFVAWFNRLFPPVTKDVLGLR